VSVLRRASPSPRRGRAADRLQALSGQIEPPTGLGRGLRRRGGRRAGPVLGLWRRAEDLGLDLERFERDRRSDAVRARVRADFESGIRAGVVTTPTLFALRDGVAKRLDFRTLEGL
jgi:hypothetical protein